MTQRGNGRMSKPLDMEEIYLSYQKKVEGYIAKRVSNQADAQELVSEVFSKVLAGLWRYDEQRASVSTWIYTIAKNTVYDYYRHHKNETWADDAYEKSDENLLPEDMLLKKEQLAQLATALEKLPERERNILILRFYHDMPAKEVAQRVGVSYANVRYLQSIALKKLQHLMQL